MLMRLSLLELAKRQKLSPNNYLALTRIARLDAPLNISGPTLLRIVRSFAALLAGLGTVFAIAANWVTTNPFPMFILLETALLGASITAIRIERLRISLTLLTVLTIGALLAFFGQHYQTGADTWQLFAIWSALVLPLAFIVRSNVLWCAWILIAAAALATGAKDFDHGWPSNAMPITSVSTFCAAAALSLMFVPWCSRYTGAGVWPLNLAVLLFVSLTVTSGIGNLANGSEGGYIGALLASSLVASALTARSLFDIRALSIAALGLDVLIIGGVFRMALEMRSIEAILVLTAIAVLATLTATVGYILKLHRYYTTKD